MSTISTNSTDDRKPPAAPKPPSVGIPEFQHATFSYGVKGQADRFVKAQRLISDYVGRTMDEDLYLLLTAREEATFLEPPNPLPTISGQHRPLQNPLLSLPLQPTRIQRQQSQTPSTSSHSMPTITPHQIRNAA